MITNPEDVAEILTDAEQRRRNISIVRDGRRTLAVWDGRIVIPNGDDLEIIKLSQIAGIVPDNREPWGWTVVLK